MTDRRASKDEGHWTEEDYQAHLGKLEKAMADAPALLRFLAQHHPRGHLTERVPFGLWAHEDHTQAVAAGQEVPIFVEPMVPMRPSHLVLSDQTAESFELTDFKIGNRSDFGTWIPIPLDSFAVRYYASQKDPQRLISLQDWSHGTVRPGQRIQVVVRNVATEPRHFRGILWANSEKI